MLRSTPLISSVIYYYTFRSIFDLLISSIIKFLYSLSFLFFSHFYLSPLNTWPPLWIYTAAEAWAQTPDHWRVTRPLGCGCWRPLAGDSSSLYFRSAKSVISQLKRCLLNSSMVCFNWLTSAAWASKSLIYFSFSDAERAFCADRFCAARFVLIQTVVAVHKAAFDVLVVRGPNSSLDGISLLLFVDILSAPNMMMIWVLGPSVTGALMLGIANSCCSNCIYSSKMASLRRQRRSICSRFCCGFFGPAQSWRSWW